MNALTPTNRPGAGALALLPRDQDTAIAFAKAMMSAGFFPKELQSVGSCLFVVEQAMRWNMSPYAVATEMSFPQGKPMFSGKLVAAAVQSSGAIQGRLHYAYRGEGNDRVVTVSATLRGETAPVSVDVRLADARTNNQHWSKSPDQMLAYHGARVWARRYAPEVMLGVYAPEEFDDAPPAGPLPPARGPVMDAAPAPRDVPTDFVMVAPDGEPRSAPSAEVWVKWCRAAIAKVAPDGAAALIRWRDAMDAHIAAVPPPHGEEVRAALEAALDEAAEREAIQAEGAP